jgi:hypothetical protein
LRYDATAQTIAATLRPVDPTFDPELFIAEARRLYTTIRTAWATADLEPVRGILTEQLLGRLAARLDQCRLRGILTEAIYPTETTTSLVGATITSATAEQVRVLFESAGYIYDLDISSGRPTSTPALRRWRETWVYECAYPTRQSQPAGECPSCHRPAASEHSFCTYCQGNLRPTVHDFRRSRRLTNPARRSVGG